MDNDKNLDQDLNDGSALTQLAQQVTGENEEPSPGIPPEILAKTEALANAKFNSAIHALGRVMFGSGPESQDSCSYEISGLLRKSGDSYPVSQEHREAFGDIDPKADLDALYASRGEDRMNKALGPRSDIGIEASVEGGNTVVTAGEAARRFQTLKNKLATLPEGASDEERMAVLSELGEAGTLLRHCVGLVLHKGSPVSLRDSVLEDFKATKEQRDGLEKKMAANSATPVASVEGADKEEKDPLEGIIGTPQKGPVANLFIPAIMQSMAHEATAITRDVKSNWMIAAAAIIGATATGAIIPLVVVAAVGVAIRVGVGASRAGWRAGDVTMSQDEYDALGKGDKKLAAKVLAGDFKRDTIKGVMDIGLVKDVKNFIVGDKQSNPSMSRGDMAHRLGAFRVIAQKKDDEPKEGLAVNEKTAAKKQGMGPV